MKLQFLRFLTLCVLSVAAVLSNAQNAPDSVAPPPFPEVTNVTNVYSLLYGSAHRADTYLTPLHYDGTASGVAYEHAYAMKTKPLVWTLDVSLEADRTMNPVRNATMLGIEFRSSWTLERSWRVADRFDFGVGGAAAMCVGALYLNRNGNNPVAANASFTIDAAASARYRLMLGRIPVIASYRASLPVFGVMFTPEYGQLYYEIYIGERKGLFGPAYWGRYFALDQLLSLDLKLGPKWLRLGYLPQIVSTRVNHITARRIDHLFVVGIRL